MVCVWYVGNERLSLLMYADDITMTDSNDYLQ